jgi:hypothetical protein
MFFRLALAMIALAGCNRPGLRLEAEPIEGTHPALVLLRCIASGIPGHPRFAWHLSPGARTSGVPPLDEDALLIQLSDTKSAETIECVVFGENNFTASAEVSVGAIAISGAKLDGAQITVEGSGFGGKPAPNDAIWLIPGRGRAIRADSACKNASWSETKLVACLPPLDKKPHQLRVQSGGRLALGPLLP